MNYSAFGPVNFIEEVKFADDCCVWFVGEGTSVVMINPKAYLRPMNVRRVFNREFVRGLCSYDKLICFYAHRAIRLAVAKVTSTSVAILLMPTVTAVPDTIVACRIMATAHLFLATASSGLFAVYTTQIQPLCSKASVQFRSGTIVGCYIGRLCILLGTSDGHLWKYLIMADRQMDNAQKIHDAAILQIVFCETTYRMCTLCDDRSCTAWQFTFTLSSDVSIYPTCLEWNSSTMRKLFTVHGHAARPWNAIFAKSGLLTVGEDGVLNMYNDDGLLLWSKRLNGGSIWSVLEANDDSLIVGTHSGQILRLTQQPVVSTYTVSLDAKKRINILHILNASPVVLLYGTNDGQLYIEDGCGRTMLQCNDKPCQKLTSCATKTRQGNLFLLLACRSGFVYKLSDRTVETFLCVEEHVCGVFLSEFADFAAICFESGNMTIVSTCNNAQPLYTIANVELALPNSCTAALWVPSHYADLFVVGDQNGAVWTYKKSELLNCQRRLHDSKPITHVAFISEKMYTCARDGKIWFWRRLGNKGYLEPMAFFRDSKITWPTRVIACYDRVDKLLVCGFAADKFLVVDHATGNTMFETVCGGGHRAFDIQLHNPRQASSCCAYVRGQTVSAQTWRFDVEILKEGCHKRKVNQVCLTKVGQHVRLVTCSDDGAVYVWNTQPNVSIRQRYSGHISSVLAMALDHPLLVTAGGRGQLFLWLFVENDLKQVHEVQLTNHRFTKVVCRRYCNEPAIWLVAAARADATVLVYMVKMADEFTFKSAALVSTLKKTAFVTSLALDVHSDGGTAKVLALLSDGELFSVDVKKFNFSKWSHLTTLKIATPSSMAYRRVFGIDTLMVGDQDGAIWSVSMDTVDYQMVPLKKMFISTVTAMDLTDDGYLAAIGSEEVLCVFQCLSETDKNAKLIEMRSLDISDPLGVAIHHAEGTFMTAVSGTGLMFCNWKKKK